MVGTLSSAGYDAASPNERIVQVLKQLREVAEHDLGFAKAGTRADEEIEITRNGVRIRYEARYVMGEGRVVLTIRKGAGPLRNREIRVDGRNSVAHEYERCRKELLNIVRRATAVKP